MFIFGDGPIGWRLFSAIFSCTVLYFFYKMIRDQTSDSDLALSSMIVLSVNKLYFTFSMLGVLDMYMMSFMIIAIFSVLKQRYVESSIFMALSSLCKLTAIFYIPMIISYMAIQSKRDYNWDLRKLLKKIFFWIIIFSLTFLILLALLDLLYVKFIPQNVTDPIKHIIYMFGTHTSANWPTGISEKPWYWLLRQNNYYLGNLSLIVNGYLESTSIIITGLAIMALPYVLIKRDKLSLISSIWLINTYLIWFPAYFLLNRPIFNFYLLPALPAISILNCTFMNENKIILWFYTLICIIFFVIFQFPFKIL